MPWFQDQLSPLYYTHLPLVGDLRWPSGEPWFLVVARVASGS